MRVSTELPVGTKVIVNGQHHGTTISLPWIDSAHGWVVMVSGAPGEIWPLEKVLIDKVAEAHKP